MTRQHLFRTIRDQHLKGQIGGMPWMTTDVVVSIAIRPSRGGRHLKEDLQTEVSDSIHQTRAVKTVSGRNL